MKGLKSELFIFSTVSVLVLFMFHWIFPTGLLGLNSMQVDSGGDGMKNYFTFAFTIKYAQFPWFDAFLYPTGDLGMYMDNQPLLAYLCIQLKNLGLFNPEHTSAWLSWFNIIGFLLAIPVIYKICKHFSLPTIWSVSVTILCISLSPQLFRMAGHYGLAYAFVIPLNWYLVLKISEDSKSIRNTFFIVLLNLLLGGIHPYMLLMNVIIVAAYWFSVLVIERKNNWYLILSMIIPVVIFLCTMEFLDPFNDRGQSPNGAWLYKTEIGDLLPFFGWFEWCFEDVVDLGETMEDGYAYVGPLLFIFLLSYVIHLGLKIFKRKTLWPGTELKIKLALCSSLLILAFAMGIHLLITDKKVMDWIPQLANFRALGRFSWGFYYIAFILLFVWFYRITDLLKMKGLKYLIIVGVLSLYVMDAYAYCLVLKQKLEIYGSRNVLIDDREISNILDKQQINLSDIQAIISLPLSTEGVEKLGFGEYYSNKVKVFPFIYQTGIPMTSTTQSRASVDQIMKSLQFANSKFGDFSIKENLDPRKQFLVVVLKEIKDQYNDLLSLAKHVGDTEKLEIWIIEPELLYERQTFADYSLNIDQWCEDSCQYIIAESFDDHVGEGLHSTGAFRSQVNYETIGTWDISIDSSDIYELSFWQFIEPVKGDVAEYYLDVKNGNEDVIERYTLSTRHKNRVEVNGHWIRYYKAFNLDKHSKSISLTVSHHDMTIDWLTMKPKGIHFYTETDSRSWLYCDHYFMMP